MRSTCAQTRTRSASSVRGPPPNRFESAFETGDQPAGHSFRPSAIRDACHRRSVVTIPAMSVRIRSASPMWLPSNRAGRCTLRMMNAVTTPANTITAKMSTRSANHPWCPSHGIVSSFATTAITAITMVGKRTRKPQKMNACIRPGTSRWSSLRWPSVITTSFRTRAGSSPERSLGRPILTSRTRTSARRVNSPPPTARTPSRTRRATGSIRPSPSGSRRRSPARPRAGRRSRRSRRSRSSARRGRC